MKKRLLFALEVFVFISFMAGIFLILQKSLMAYSRAVDEIRKQQRIEEEKARPKFVRYIKTDACSIIIETDKGIWKRPLFNVKGYTIEDNGDVIIKNGRANIRIVSNIINIPNGLSLEEISNKVKECR